jgi:pimeloyl-ACP methyl ester carboxylesterase
VGHFLTVNGTEVFYNTWGDSGAWVTLINGYTRSSRDFARLARLIAQNGQRVLVFDNRGAGRTVVAEPFSFCDMVEDVLALWSALGIESSHLLGISMGGMLAQHLAVHYPDKISKLILVATASSEEWLNQENQTVWDKDIFESLRPFFSPLFFESHRMLIQAMAKSIADEVARGNLIERAAWQRKALARFDITPLVGHITAETLIIHGSGDGIIPVAAARDLARFINGARLKELEGIGHMVLAEASDCLIDSVTSFLSDRDNASPV